MVAPVIFTGGTYCTSIWALTGEAGSLIANWSAPALAPWVVAEVMLNEGTTAELEASTCQQLIVVSKLKLEMPEALQAVAVEVRVIVGLLVGVFEGVLEGELVGVLATSGVLVGDWVAVLVVVGVGELVAVFVITGVMVKVWVFVIPEIVGATEMLRVQLTATATMIEMTESNLIQF
jgi:hypothetical protein